MMTIEQFIELTEAYGAETKNWPEVYQKEALEVIALNFTEVNQALERARFLDEILLNSSVEPVERALFERIVVSAVQTNKAETRKIFWQQWSTKKWLGLSSLIGTSLAGAVAGAFFVSIWTSGMLPESIDGLNEPSGVMSQYIDIGQEWS